MTQDWYNAIGIFYQFHILLFLEMETILTDLLLSNFEATQCKNRFDTNLVKMHSVVSEIFLMFCAILTADDGHLGMQNCEKSKWLHIINILAQSWVNFNQGFLRYCR